MNPPRHGEGDGAERGGGGSRSLRKPTVYTARKLRRDMSLPEVLRWQELRKRPGGLKFRRQHPAGLYTADFFRHDARVVEIDGETHDRGDRPARDVWFAERRFGVVRLPAFEILRNLEGAVAGIVAQAESGSSPPRAGED